MTSPTAVTTICPRCSAAATGNYCANCGAPLAGAKCSACDAPLTPGANFCHRCGTATPSANVSSPAAARTGDPRGFSPGLPWSVAIVAFVALVALVVGQRFGARARDVTPAEMPQPGARAPDISQMSPEEQAVRLHDRVMSLADRGRTDSVPFFAGMAIRAFQRLDSLSLDNRYDLGNIGVVSGDTDLARAQADTILARSPNHLLGLILAIRAARAAGDSPRAQALERRFIAVAPAERAKQLPEYRMHQREIDAALATLQPVNR